MPMGAIPPWGVHSILHITHTGPHTGMCPGTCHTRKHTTPITHTCSHIVCIHAAHAGRLHSSSVSFTQRTFRTRKEMEGKS